MAHVDTAANFLGDNQGVQLGYNHGIFSANFYPKPERPETPPSPSDTIPFRRDVDFVDRGEILNQIHEKCSAPTSRAALFGLGGVGKSQLAIEYSYRVRERSPQTWVFWVHASTAARFEEGYRAIADKVKLPGRNEPKADILQLVRSWLCNEGKGKWLMVLDNADDVSVFFDIRGGRQGPPSGDSGSRQVPSLSTYLPQSHNGSILITTRDEDAAFRLTGAHRDIIRVEPMGQGHAIALLEKKLGHLFDEETAPKLTQALDYMPLAIAQAAAHINRVAPRSSVSKYVDEFRKSDRSKTNLLNYDAGDLRRDNSASNSIITTWQISFDHIRDTKPSAADLLSLMSFFDRQGIPEFLLHSHERGYSNDNTGNIEHENDNSEEDEGSSTASEDSDDKKFEDDIAILRGYSLIATNIEGDTFEMHGLVQLSTRRWLEAHSQLERWKQHYITRMCRVFPTGDYQNWGRCHTLFAHAEVAVGQKPADESSLKDWASVLHNAGWYAWTKGSYITAERMARKAVSTRGKVLGKEHPHTLASVANLAGVLQAQGKYEEAEEMVRRALEGREKVLGKEHPDTLSSVYCLAYLLHKRKQYKQAEVLYQRACTGYARVLGFNHPKTLACSRNYSSMVAEMADQT